MSCLRLVPVHAISRLHPLSDPYIAVYIMIHVWNCPPGRVCGELILLDVGQDAADADVYAFLAIQPVESKLVMAVRHLVLVIELR